MKRLLALLLALGMCAGLAGCGDKNAADPSASPSETAVPSESAAPSESPAPADAVDPRLMPDNAVDATAKILGFPNSTTLLTVNGEAVTAEEYLYWLGNMTAYYKNLYGTYYGVDLDLTQETEEGSGVTWDDQMKEIAYQNSVLLAITPRLAEENGVTLSQEEQNEMAQNHADTVESTGEDVYAYQLQAMNVNDTAAYRMNWVSGLFNRVQETWMEKAAGTVTAAEVDAYVEEQDLLRAKHILLLTKDPSSGEEYDQETADAQKAKAEDILAQLRAGADFDTLMQENSEDSGLESKPDGYLFTKGQMVAEFEAGTRALGFDEISPELVESTYGYHIIKRLDPDCDEVRQAVAESKFNDMVQAAVDGADVVKAPEYDTFTTADYYDALLQFQSTLEDPAAKQSAEPTESAAPTESAEP